MNSLCLRSSVSRVGLRGYLGCLVSVAFFFFFSLPTAVAAQTDSDITPEMLERVLPDADRFGPSQGNPPVFEGFRAGASDGTETLVGYAFLTSDVPPEEYGYSGPIEVLVGLNLDGALTGVEVVAYRESLRATRGDFLRQPSFLRQFRGKPIHDGFRLRQDVDGVTGATISVAAMSIGIRNAARRVARAYLEGADLEASPIYIGTIDLNELRNLSWEEMIIARLAREVEVVDQDSTRLVLGLAYVREAAVGEILLGPDRFQEGLEALGAGVEADGRPLMVFTLNGPDAFLFRPSSLFFVQGDDTTSVSAEDFSLVGLLSEGMLQRQVRRAGLLSIDQRLDVTQPFEIVIDLSPDGPISSTVYRVREGAVLASSPERVTPEAPGAPAGVGSDTLAAAGEAPAAVARPAAERMPIPVQVQPADDRPALLFDDFEEEQTVLGATLARTSWMRVGGLLVLMGLVMWAFLSKRTALRWATLAATLVLLGFVDGGFLSVSHITAGISVGPGVYLADLPLLLLVVFTLITTLLWGRVFCGFLCPFGALQDFLDRIVPLRFRRELPSSVHGRALLMKYGILVLVLTPALFRARFSLFQYFEPFGTVFYWSTSPILWLIALGFLIGSAIVPRFYCRYACPLGAALALGSLLSPLRIRRVEQCQFCKVCEQKCPTGAIWGPKIDFKECVRCNICDVQLIKQSGACAHDISEIEQRLVQLPMAGPGASRR